MTRRRTLAGAALGAALFALGLAPARAEGPLRVGLEAAYPPFAFKAPDGSLQGFDVEIADALCAQMGRTCAFTENDWDGIIPALLAGKFDAIISSMGITEDRKRRVDFTDRYYYSASALIAPKDTIEKPDAEGTAGKAIGVQRGTAHACFVRAHFPEAEVREYVTTEEAYLDLTSGRVDAVLVDAIPGAEWLKANDADGEYAAVSDTLYDAGCFGEGIGIAVRKGDDELRQGLNAAIQGIRASGVYQEISKRYFGRDIYGPEG